MAATSPQDNFIRCHAALHTLLSHTIPSLQHAIDTWHKKVAATTQPCSNPAQCPSFKKPSAKNKSCQECITWATAIESQAYPCSAIGSLQWMNANSTLFFKDPLEVMKLFVLRMPANQRNAYSSLGDFDTASLLMIMAKFKEFHHGDQAVFDMIQKVAQIRNSLAHMKHAKSLNLDDQTFNCNWTDVINLVNSLPGLGNPIYTQKTSQDLIRELTKIKHLSTDPSTWQKQLQALYRSKRSGIGFLPGSFEEFPSDEYFVDLQLAKEQKTPTQVKSVKLQTYKDVLSLYDERGHVLKHVLISGLAGMGKTTMMSRLAYQWASMNLSQSSQVLSNPLQAFQHVFLLDMRKITPDMGLLDAICGQLLGNVSRHELEEYLTKNADKCLYLFDGFDELNVMNTIFKCQLIYDSHVIVTTRPNKVSRFQEIHQNYVQVIIEGFTEESIKRFIVNFFRSTCETSSISELLSEIGSNYVIANLKHFPLLLGMVCLIWREKKSVPQTVSNLYHQVIQFLIRHWKSREIEDSADLSFEEFKAHVQFDQVIASIGKTALHGLLEDSKLIFKEDEFESAVVIKQCCYLGILSSESKISGFDMITYVSFIHKTFQEYCAALYLASLADSDETLFKTLLSQMDFDDMEYVLRFCCGSSEKAAELLLTNVVHVCKGNAEMELGKMGYSESKIDSCRLPFVLLFEAEYTFGVKRTLHIILRPALHIIIMNMTDDFLNDPVYSAALKYFVSKFETQHEWAGHVKMVTIHTYSRDLTRRNGEDGNGQKQLLQKIVQFKKITLGVVYTRRGMYLDYDPTSLTDLQTLSAFTNSLLCPINELTLTRTVSCKTICKYLHQTPATLRIHLACLDIQSTTNPETVAYVLQTIHSRSGSIRALITSLVDMWALFLHNTIINAINDEVIKYMAPFYSMMKRIELNHVDISQEGMGTMFEGMSQAGKLSLLEKISLINNSINSTHAKDLAVALKKMPKLRRLHLCDNKLGCEGVIALSESLQYTTKLEEIRLNSNDIGCEGVKSLASVMQYTTKLRGLELSNNKIRCDGVKAIASALESNTLSLELLHLHKNQIQCNGAKAIASALESNTSLVWLCLSYNQIQCDGATAIASVLKSKNTSLKRIDLDDNQIKSDGAKSLEGILALQSRRRIELYPMLDPYVEELYMIYDE